MTFFKPNIGYLEDDDFTNNGLLSLNESRPVLVMIQGSYCGYCTKMKPEYQKAADKVKKCKFTTIELDGKLESEQKLAKRLDHILPITIKGVPTVIAYKGGNFYKEYTGDRSEQSLIEFANNL